MYLEPHAQARELLWALDRHKRNRSGKKITSDNRLVDWFFCKTISALNDNDKVEKIWLVKSLRDRKTGRAFSGLYNEEDNQIYVSAAKTQHSTRMEMAETLLHEALHAAFESFPEFAIEFLERYIWKRSHKEQKMILLSYVPRRIRKIIIYD